ncbi:MAG TPA: hypothetical protein VGI40_19795 [Pirellulaceae bacterium]|jgi:hypothetical protein
MRFRVRTLLIVLAIVVYVAMATVGVMYASPAALAASDYVMELGARAVYRGVCYAAFD